MEDVKEISLAIMQARADIAPVVKNRSNQVSKTAIVKYADINSVLEAVLPALRNHGVALMQPIVALDNGGYCVRTLLVHTPTGQTIHCDTPIYGAGGSAQAFGSGVTYARRYGIVSLLCLEAEDDDGAKASKSSEALPKNQEEVDEYMVALGEARTLEELRNIWLSIPNHLKADRNLIAEAGRVRGVIENGNA